MGFCFGQNNPAYAHGMHLHPLYVVWHRMKDRCYNPKASSYHNYGARGVRVCNEWLDAASFLSWALVNGWEEGLHIDRIDDALVYGPTTCRFVSRSLSMVNRRTFKTNTSGYTGILHHRASGKWEWQLQHKKERYTKAGFDHIISAVLARNQYIINNNLPHKIQSLKEDAWD